MSLLRCRSEHLLLGAVGFDVACLRLVADCDVRLAVELQESHLVIGEWHQFQSFNCFAGQTLIWLRSARNQQGAAGRYIQCVNSSSSSSSSS